MTPPPPESTDPDNPMQLSDDTTRVCKDQLVGNNPPWGFVYYNKNNPVHKRYGFSVSTPDGMSKPPHYIHFNFDATH